jgi:regulatory protein
VSAYTDALRMLSRRELSVAECRARLADLEHPDADIERAIALLRENRSLDDARFAREYARMARDVKGRGRVRVLQELRARGIDTETASEAIGAVFGDSDERSLVARALQKKMRGGRPRQLDSREYARLYQHLMRQGFTPAAIAEGLRKLRKPQDDEVE